MKTPIAITEEVTLHCEQVDTEKGVIRGVKLLGLESKNGRSYLDKALAEAITLYEGAKVNVNHPKGSPLSPRDYQDRLGVVRDVQHRAGDGLYGDFHFNPKHNLAEQFIWDAQTQPSNVGFSHNVLARTARNGGKTVVEAITKVVSLDLVADPATTSGLFEQEGAETSRAGTREKKPNTADAFLPPLASVTLEELEAERPDLLEAITGNIRTKVLAEAASTLREIREAALPGVALDDAFIENVVAANKSDRTQLIHARTCLVESVRKTAASTATPRSAPKPEPQKTPDAKAFASAIK